MTSMDRWRLLLDSGVHPAVLARVCRWGRPHSDDLATEILRLAHMDVIKVHWAMSEDALGHRAEDYRLSRSASAAAARTDPLDAITLKMLFDVVAAGSDELWLNDIRRFAKRDADTFRKAMLSWQAEMADAVKRRGSFSPLSALLQQVLPAAAAVCLLVGLFALLATGSPAYLVGLAAVAVALIVAGRQMPHLSPEAASQYEAAKRLQLWLRDLPSRDLDESIPVDQAFWNKLMPLAFMLGEANAAVAAFESAVPGATEAAFCDEGGESASGGANPGDNGGANPGDNGGASSGLMPDTMRELAWPAWYQAPSAASRSAESALPSLADLLPELIASTAFAADEVVSSDMAFTHAITALIFPINSMLALLGVPRIGIPGVEDPSTAMPSAAQLFKRQP